MKELMGYATSKKDAVLFAAAPDLLEALEELVDSCENHGLDEIMEAIPKAIKAIKKAKGELQ